MDLAEVGRRGLHLHPLDHLSLALGSPPENPRLHTAQLENLSQDEVQRVTFAFKASTCLSDLTLRHQVNKSETQNIKNTDDSSVCPHPPNSAVTSKASLPLFLPHPLLPGLTPPNPAADLSDQISSLPLSDRRPRSWLRGYTPHLPASHT